MMKHAAISPSDTRSVLTAHSPATWRDAYACLTEDEAITTKMRFQLHAMAAQAAIRTSFHSFAFSDSPC